MASLTPTGLETITYGQQGWNAIVTANMQRLNTTPSTNTAVIAF